MTSDEQMREDPDVTNAWEEAKETALTAQKHEDKKETEEWEREKKKGD